ncbi:MAG: hypothetical protein GTN84_11840 [Hydrogenophaga sp.]|uniref:hypothetical protein n=1 Tax=Hydrogenophaga sp. TaxID=1904254 RepID=UPI001698B780|nr:hypothetical protein [Hydrogenophaga sp.]NIM41774.1 hypothetical protein [Hydrogenophaga sp.]NIN27079.1 hypothetical protein [Hydrogenophaga sp.]NIN31780.1 hypothetical protein [Hydrogenophaga sp.]NIN56024.1 hypothetical protein [Hydrogenophaga sp.]NIO52151.1 hypothetical protein [Hydrogenophaga sp.]
MAIHKSNGKPSVLGPSLAASQCSVDNQKKEGVQTGSLSSTEVPGTEPEDKGEVTAHAAQDVGRKLTASAWQIPRESVKSAVCAGTGAVFACAAVATALAVPGREPAAAVAALSGVAGLARGVMGFLFRQVCCPPDRA